jgi:hypothetical protein
MIYKQIRDLSGALVERAIAQQAENTSTTGFDPSRKIIPFDPANTDYQTYLEWIAEGNEPLPADEPAGE